ncbi:MAG: anti-sigma factor, partial [Leptothrix sp. (in: b-proteobacteria)]
ARVEARLAHDELAKQMVLQWQDQREQLQALHRDLLDEPVPPALLAAAARLPVPAARRPHWLLRWSAPWTQALAAGLLLALGVGAGWVGHRELGGPLATLVSGATPGGEVVRAIAQDAMAAHVVYAPDPRRPVEIGADQQELLLRWLSRRLGHSLQLPELGELGWQLVGGRLLSGDTRGAAPARAQFMYQNSEGQRLTLYLSVLAPASTAAPERTAAVSAARQPAAPASADVAAFGFATAGPTRSFYWTEGSFGYALVGDLPRDALHRLVNEVYAQTARALP